MIEKEFKASKFTLLVLLGSILILLLPVIIMNIKRGWSIALVPLLILSFIGLVKFYKFSRKPLFRISDRELNTFNPPRRIEIAKIISVKSEGKYKLELLMKDQIPVPLFINDLSSKDRRDLELTIKQAIERKS